MTYKIDVDQEVDVTIGHMATGMMPTFHHPVGTADIANVVLAGGTIPWADKDSRAAPMTCAAFVAGTRLGSW